METGIACGGNPEYLAFVGAGDLGPRTGTALRADNLMDRDVDVGKS